MPEAVWRAFASEAPELARKAAALFEEVGRRKRRSLLQRGIDPQGHPASTGSRPRRANQLRRDSPGLNVPVPD